MERKRLFIILGTLLVSLLIIVLVVRGRLNKTNSLVPDITLCGQNLGELCIITFVATDPGLMAINFQLTGDDYPLFYVKGLNRGISYDYSCYPSEAAPLSVYCTGPRTPLGESIELEVYDVENNTLLARGKVVVAAFIVWTPAGVPALTDITATPATAIIATPLIGATTFPSSTQTAVTTTPITAYPNP
ncbi:hypothetical protein [Candidatus Villigracilis saccharophilus]|uniref:hypothetical protein n=1 Tax=Candidatus Villigracilis saccharophilus TaxID=3140684 RepID=UPI003135FFB7|nr:hypothetical protein [Anaerolineales bacterium]